MSENNSLNTIINLIPNSLDNAATNLTDLPTKSIGQTLSDCWYLIFGSISQAAEKRRIQYAADLEKFKNELTSSIESVPDELRIEADSQIALSALNNAKFCIEKEELRAMYVKLLTSSVDSRKTVHPSFSQIILSMDCIDAVILKQFKDEPILAVCDYNIYTSNEALANYNTYASNIFLSKPDTISLSDASRSLDVLKRLGLIDIQSDVYITDSNAYDGFKKTDIYHQLLTKYPEKLIYLQEKIASLTNLGKSFIDCCLS